MEETRFMISDAAKKVDVETHVLRYWEEELDLPISRTELGHRYYTEEDIQVFQNIKELKERGFQLKAIKVLIPELRKKESKGSDNIINLEERIHVQDLIGKPVQKEQEEPVEKLCVLSKEADVLIDLDISQDKLKQFEAIVGNVFRKILMENNAELESSIAEVVVKEMDLLMRIREEREEERYRKLDETIRAHQKKRNMVAATKEKEKENRKKSRWSLF